MNDIKDEEKIEILNKAFAILEEKRNRPYEPPQYFIIPVSYYGLSKVTKEARKLIFKTYSSEAPFIICIDNSKGKQEFYLLDENGDLTKVDPKNISKK